MTTRTLERRLVAPELAAARLEVREAEGPARIVGYAAVFYRATVPGTEYELWEGAVERILPGAFDRAIREDDVRALVNHDTNHLLGRTKSKTLRLKVDDVGLLYEIDPPDTSAGRDAVVSMQRGDLSGSSFSFYVTDEVWLKEDGRRVREIRGVELWDVGPVVFPAYEGTTVGVRADGDPAEARESLARSEAVEREREGMDMDVRLAQLRDDG